MGRKAVITDIAFSSDGQVVIRGDIWTDGEDVTQSKVEIIFRKFREEGIAYRSVIDVERVSSGFANIFRFFSKWSQRYRFCVKVAVPFDELPSSIYGFELRGTTGGIGIRTYRSRSSLIFDDKREFVLCAFVEPVAQVWRIEFFRLTRSNLEDLREYAKRPRGGRPLVVIGEYTNGARDNGRALHESIQAQDFGLDSRYIIEKENMDAYPLQPDSVLEFGSMEHLKACLDSSVCAFTHHRSYVYPYILFHLCSDKYTAVPTVFMQHGITAMKKSVMQNYRKKRSGYDAVLVCSRLEKSIFVDNFDYTPEEVKLTGFPRHDALVRQMENGGNATGEVLFFPTWRRGFDKIPSAGFEASEFFGKWKDAMESVRKAGFRSALVLHPMLSRHEDSLSPFVDRVAPLSEFQDNLVVSSCLVTDYSSVSFDALLVDRNVLLFQFDQDEFGIRNDAFIDVDKELPGEFVPDVDTLVKRLVSFRQNGWAFEQSEKRDLYFQYKDDHASTRVAEVVKELSAIYETRMDRKRVGT